MRIETSLDVDKRTATVTIHTDEKAFTMTYELDKVVKQLDDLSTNWLAQKILDVLGLKVEVHKKA
jgi:hypothetical protein